MHVYIYLICFQQVDLKSEISLIPRASGGMRVGGFEDDVKKLSVKIDESATKSTKLKEEVKEIQAELAALSKEQSELDKIRSDQHAVYQEAFLLWLLWLGGPVFFIR